MLQIQNKLRLEGMAVLREMGDRLSEWPLGALLLFDGFFLGSYVLLWSTGWLHAVPKLDLGWQGSIQEHFAYLKWFACGLIGLWLFFRSRELLYLAWAALFLCFFAEDAESLRNPVGLWIAKTMDWGPAAGLTGQGFGEVTADIIGAIVLLGALAFVHSRSDHRPAKAFSSDLVPLLGGLMIFGIGVDTLHAMVGRIPVLDFGFGVIEEGGEMVMASMLTAAFYLHAFPYDAPADTAALAAAVADEPPPEAQSVS